MHSCLCACALCIQCFYIFRSKTVLIALDNDLVRPHFEPNKWHFIFTICLDKRIVICGLQKFDYKPSAFILRKVREPGLGVDVYASLH